MMRIFSSLWFFIVILGGCANAEPAAQTRTAKANADVVFVKAQQDRTGTWAFAVSVSHPDTGWKDYADGWDVLDANGVVLKAKNAKFTRLLVHPHVGEIPFTRAASGLKISTNQVTVRAHDMLDGFGGKTVTVDLSKDKGPGFTVQRRQ